MSLQTISVPALHNGVSQQPASVRSPDQAALVENAWSSLADGLQTRPPTERIAKLLNTPIDSAYVHSINRDASERYTVIAVDGRLRVFSSSGEEMVVEFPAGWGYLEGIEDFASDISMTTVADYTFVVNRRVRPAMLAPTAPPPNPDETGGITPREPGGGGWVYDNFGEAIITP